VPFVPREVHPRKKVPLHGSSARLTSRSTWRAIVRALQGTPESLPAVARQVALVVLLKNERKHQKNLVKNFMYNILKKQDDVGSQDTSEHPLPRWKSMNLPRSWTYTEILQ
jgi:hypothetical protein